MVLASRTFNTTCRLSNAKGKNIGVVLLAREAKGQNIGVASLAREAKGQNIGASLAREVKGHEHWR